MARNKFYLENWFLSLPRAVSSYSSTSPLLYPEIYRIGNSSKRSESRIFLLAPPRLSGRRWRKERRRHSGDAIIRNIRMFFPKLSREWQLYEEAMNLKKKRHALSPWMRMPALRNASSSVIITRWMSTHKDKQNNKVS